MSNDNVFEKLWKQQASINKLILDGKRDPEEVSRVLQAIIQGRKLVEVRLIQDDVLS